MPVWFDRFLKKWANAGQIQDPSDSQANAGFAFLGQAPPTVELFNALLQYNDLKDSWLYGQIANVINADGTVVSDTDLYQLLHAITGRFKRVLTASTTMYVDINGDDTLGDGTINKPWKTIQFAINYILNKIDLAGFGVNIQLKTAGTYANFGLNQSINGYIAVTGDRLNPKNYLIKSTSTITCYANYGGVLYVYGLAFESSGADIAYSGSGTAIIAGQGSTVIYQDVAFGPCSSRHMWAAGGSITPAQSGVNYIIYGGAPIHGAASTAGTMTAVAAICTIQNNPTFSAAFWYSQFSGLIQIWDNWRVGSGTCVGMKYSASYNSSIISNNGMVNCPGTIAGVADASTGGYVQ